MARKGKLNQSPYRSVAQALETRATRERLPIERIVSGGQAGVDRAALDFALEHGIPHGGWCPRGRVAEDGEIESCYELKETPDADYPQRTEWNVRDSDGTVIFTIAPELSGGSALTHELAVEYRKPVLHVSRVAHGQKAPERLREFIRRHHIKVLNVAGPRLSTEPAARAFATLVLKACATSPEIEPHPRCDLETRPASRRRDSRE